MGVKVQSVSIIPDDSSAGRCVYETLFTGRRDDHGKVERAIMISLAGPVAHKRFHPRSYRRTRGDYDHAIGLCRFLAGSGWRELLKEREQATLWLVDLYWKDIRNVAAALLKRRELTGRAVTRIIKRRLKLREEDRADRERWERAEAETDPHIWSQ